jgi:hypothetical protein
MIRSLLLVSVFLACPVFARQLLYVAPDGNDGGTGSADQPLASLGGARDAIRKIKAAGDLPDGGIEVVVRPGTYRVADALEFGEEDSGTAEAPIVYRAAERGNARLTGGHALTGFTEVTDPEVLARLESDVRSKVRQLNLKEQGMPALGNAVNPVQRLEFFFNGEPMTLARWPNEGWTVIKDVPEQDEEDGTGGQIIYLDERTDRWVNEPEIWLYGCWRYQWSDDFMRVAAIDLEENLITFAPPRHSFGYSATKAYFALNLLCELDRPGEWYLDRETGKLYFYPPASFEQGRAEVSRASNVLRMEGASHLTFDGFVVEASQSAGVVLESCYAIQFVGCTFHNTGDAGLQVKGGKDVAVIGCDITETGGHGIDFIGGSIQRLEAANHLALNNHIWRVARWKRMARLAINLHGVGHRVAHNLIHDMPHSAMWFGGNDHVIEFNEIHSVCYEAQDAGAIYTGRNWTSRGNIVRNNFFHDVHGLGGRFAMGVYLDDMFSSADIYNNLFYRVLNPVIIGGGRDNLVANNIFVESGPAITIDDRAMQSWAGFHADAWLKEQKEKGTISGIAFDKPPYSVRYPRLAKIMEGTPKAPEGNVVARNISYNGRWSLIHAGAAKYVRVENNLVDVDPHFVDPENLDFRLRDDSPALKLGFKPLPLDKVGLINDETRATWPVRHEVIPLRREHRPWPTPPSVLRVRHTTDAIKIDGSLDVDPSKDKRLAFNITVRKSADNQWRMWRGTGTATFEVFEAGFIELE